MALSGQKTVSVAGTAEALGSQAIAGPIQVKALPDNTGNAYIGNDGANDVTSANGFVLTPGDSIVFSFLDDLSSLYVDVDTSTEGVCWHVLSN